MRKLLAIGISVAMVLSLFVSVVYAGQQGTTIEPKAPDNKPKNIEKFKEKRAGNEDVRVIITLTGEATDDKIQGLQQKVGKFKADERRWKYAYPNGFAATVKENQIDDIKKDPDVARVDEDHLDQIQLETANYWSGATTARLPPTTGYGVDGDRTGNLHSYSSTDIVIAVVDTGIDPKHKDLTGSDNGGTAKIIGWYDAVFGVATPYDDNGHGTHVASIAAGEGDSSTRYKGVAPGAALVGIKVCSSGGGCWESDMIDGFNWVINNKAAYNIKIMTVSIGGWGSSDGTDPVSVAANNVVNNGIVTTIAAGNSGDQKYTISSPGAAANVITVGAIADPGYRLRALTTATSESGLINPDKTQKAPAEWMNLADNGWYLAPFSSRGPTADNRIKPDVVAPGVSITAAEAIYPNSASYHGGYVTYSGTSMATPFVAGVAALLLDANPALTPAQVKNYIRNSAEDFGATGCDIDFGCGRVRVMRALFLATGVDRGYGPGVSHQRYWSAYTDTAPSWKLYPVTVANVDYPLAATLVQYDWSGYWPGIDVDALIEDTNGVLVAGSMGYGRQETVVVSPETTGIWRTDLYRWIGSGRFSLDISYK